MKIFNLFSRKQEENAALIPEVKENVQVHDNNSDSKSENKDEDKPVITITWGTGMPIDVIFNFIHKNYEEEGFQDALVNQDITYRDAKVTIIRNNLEMLFKRITLRYKSNIREVMVRIENSRKAFALGAAADLEARLATYEEHLAEITEMEKLLANDDPKMTTMTESYKRGFLKGVSAATINFINNNH
jgi:hypothetical protein